jgi:hypothetical protein
MNISWKTLGFIIISVSVTTLLGLLVYQYRNSLSSSPESLTGLAPNDPRMRRYTSPSSQLPSKAEIGYVFQSESAFSQNSDHSWLHLFLVSLGLVGVDNNVLKKNKVHSVQNACYMAGEDEIPEENGEESKPAVNRTKRRSQFQEMGLSVLKDIIKEYGGNPEALKENARVKGVVNPSTGRLLEFDALYTEGGHAIAVEFQGSQHTQYPNAYHRTRHDFQLQQDRDKAKSDAAEHLGIFLIPVPHHVERCVPDAEEPSGWRYDASITKAERYSRLRVFIEGEMIRYYNHRTATATKA